MFSTLPIGATKESSCLNFTKIKGDNEFVMRTRAKLGIKAAGARIMENSEGYALREAQNSYSRFFAPEKRTLRQKNAYFGDVSQ